ncbi:MAG: glycoside hydrolase family 3 C-terminal domain-containing protein [Planctomycetales bacterium]|nr:glycoside hydrolase family 3 C-terminal domain-containing protein [Planctomycetales bacterium]
MSGVSTRYDVGRMTRFAVMYLAAASVIAGACTAADLSVHDVAVDAWLARMTLAEKVGQMAQAEASMLKNPADISELALGSVLCGGNGDPPDGNHVEAWGAFYDRCQTQARQSRLKIPLLFGIDAMHGHSNVLGAVIFPHNVGLGCTRNPELVKAIGRVTALEMRATGVNWAFAPCVTVPQDDRWGRTYEGYGESADLSAQLGVALIDGLQGNDLASPDCVLACAKHFLGDGGTVAEMRVRNPGEAPRFCLDQGDVQVDEKTLRAVHLPAYVAAVDAGVGSVMVSYSSWNGLKCTANSYLLTDVLKSELGFQGIVISDYRAIAQTDPDFRTAIKKSINAGIDMAMEPGEYREFIGHLIDLVEQGEVAERRIDDAVRRILRVKAAMGLLGESPLLATDPQMRDEFGSTKRRDLARRAVRESIVLLKNNDHALPLNDGKGRIHVVGQAANDVGIQCGGWTIDWQGATGEVTPGGTTMLAALRNAVKDSAEVTHDLDGAGASGALATIVVVGEKPYAEFEGDRQDLALSQAEQDLVRRVKSTGSKVILVVYSGRPLPLGTALDDADAVLAAWLPGTEASGVADVLTGAYAPTGKLSYSWPKRSEQHPLNYGADGDDEAGYDPQFPYGYGLTYDGVR